MSRAKRPTQDYLAAAQSLAALIPSLRKYKRRKRLKPQEKSAIALKEKAMRGLYNLQPVTPRQAKFLKKYDLLVKGEVHTKIKSGPRRGQFRIRTVRGINAIQLANTGEKVSLKIIGENLMVTTNGRTWAYQGIDILPTDPDAFEDGEDDPEREENIDANVSNMEKGGRDIFSGTFKTVREAFPIEKILKLAKKAFANPTVKMVGLWTTKGRVGEVFEDFTRFARWVKSDFSQYKNTERWVNGIAALIADVNDKVDFSDWRTGYNAEKIRKARAARRRARRLHGKRH